MSMFGWYTFSINTFASFKIIVIIILLYERDLTIQIITATD